MKVKGAGCFKEKKKKMRQFESIFGKREGNIFCIKVLRHVPCVREHEKEQTLKGFLRKEEVMQHFAHDGF